MAKASWGAVSKQLAAIREQLVRQNFIIELAHALYVRFKNNIPPGRTDINIPAICVYWANEIYEHYVLNDFDLRASNVYIDPPNFYSYLDLLEINENNSKTGNETHIVDWVFETTDVKTGDDLDEWLSSSDFENVAEDFYVDNNHDILIDAGLLEVRKNRSINKSNYWKYSNWLMVMRVMNPEFDTIVTFIIGSYSEYES